MSEYRYDHTVSEAGQQIKNAIDGYRMGSIRALAQEPVQNAIDAARYRKEKVCVEYRLLSRQTLEGKRCYMLTVTDSGTTGLQGDVLDRERLKERGFELDEGENWTAFEGNGFTKKRADAHGSRGQGKSAFFYHSNVPGPRRRMLMLYDTLLPNGEYRLGVRFVQPADHVRIPPLFNVDAQDALKQDWFDVDEGVAVPLGLDPLREIGTRVIVPFLSTEALDALRSCELECWLQRCWWRAIQTDRLQITVVNEEVDWEHKIHVPEWWRGFPRRPQAEGEVKEIRSGCHRLILKDVTIPDSELGIKRLVLLHDENLSEDEIIDDQPEFAGIQLLRDQQWVETFGTAGIFGISVPSEKHAGFRGFVEFDKSTDEILREIENSQHESFDGRRGGHKKRIRDYLKEQVREFAVAMGWDDRAAVSQQEVSRREMQTFQRFVNTFLPATRSISRGNGSGDKESGLRWNCQLSLVYPEPDTARVDWGETLSNVRVLVEWEPADQWPGAVELALEHVFEAGSIEIWRGKLNSIHSGHEQSFGDWHVLKGRANLEKQQISCPEPRDYRLRAVVIQSGQRVARTERRFYVQCEPPPPPEKRSQTISVSLSNDSSRGQQRFSNGDIARLQINVKNRAREDVTVKVTASLGKDWLLLDEKSMDLPATPAGDTPRRVQAFFGELKLRLALPEDSHLTNESQETIALVPGIHTIQADLFDETGEEILAGDSQRLYFEHDPQTGGSNLPFELSQIRANPYSPMWELNSELDKLTYPADYPLWKELQEVTRPRSALAGKMAFTSEICANGLLEWALRPLEDGAASNLEQLQEGALQQDQNGNDELWDQFERRLETLARSRQYESDSHPEYADDAKTWRETVAVMLAIFQAMK